MKNTNINRHGTRHAQLGTPYEGTEWLWVAAGLCIVLIVIGGPQQVFASNPLLPWLEVVFNLTVIGIVVRWWLRRRSAAPVVLALEDSGTCVRMSRWWGAGSFVLASVSYLAALILSDGRWVVASPMQGEMVSFTLVWTNLMWLITFILLTRVRCEIRGDGLWGVFSFVPWRRMRGWHWDTPERLLLTTLTTVPGISSLVFTHAIKVAAGKQAAVDAALCKHLNVDT